MSSLGIEVLEAVPKPDVVVVCCGGGGLLAGVAAAIKLSGCEKTRIYGVEPEGGKSSTVTSPQFTGGASTVTCGTVNIGFVVRLCFFLTPSMHHVPKFH